jgi:acyl-CoA thioesterase FadM
MSADDATRASATSPSRHDTAYRVRFDEAGPDGTLRTSGLMRFAQDLAWLHSTALGFGREWYAERGLTWLVRAAELEVLVPVPMGTSLAARTEVTGMRRVFARRRGEFHLPDGTLAAWVHTDWVLIDASGGLTRIPPVFVEMFGGSGPASSITRLELPPTPPAATHRALTVRPHELDPMGHVNNAIYLDWLEETIAAAGGGPALSTTSRRYRLEYALAASPGLGLDAAAWPSDGGWSFRLTRPDTGTDLFRARLATDLRSAPGSDVIEAEDA